MTEIETCVYLLRASGAFLYIELLILNPGRGGDSDPTIRKQAALPIPPALAN
jgi:hypothetical protein